VSLAVHPLTMINLNDLLRPTIRSSKPKDSKPLDLRPPRQKPIGVVAALEKKSFPVDSPVVKVSHQVKTVHDFEVFVRAFLHKYPHYQWLRKHQSTWSNNITQYILFDTSRKVQVAFTKIEIEEKLRLN